MHLDLSTWSRKCAYQVVCLTAVTFYIAAVARHYVAFRLGARSDRQSLERAVKLEPGNAELPWKLGRYSLFVTQDPTGAVRYLETAASLNPHLARYWLDVAAAYQFAGDLKQQQRALGKALQAEPTAPDVAWEAGNFYLAQGDLTRAFPLLRTVIENDPTQVTAALQLCWRAS